MGSFAWDWIVAVGILALVVWLVIRATGRNLSRTIQNATHAAGVAYAKSLEKSDLESKAAKYDALAKLKTLHQSAIISDSEYESEKSKIMK